MHDTSHKCRISNRAVGPGDFRPISVVPVLSRILERIVVSRYIYPVFDHLPFRLQIQDQFAFRPTGSTSAALIDLLQKVTEMLLNNEYVEIISVDFTEAFERVRHHALSIKYLQLDLPDHIHNWLMDYFKGRGHLTRAGDVSSLFAWINASIIQGSGEGPPSYVVEASDLHPRSSQNAITKFADDTYLLVGSTSIGTINEEFNNIEQWAN